MAQASCVLLIADDRQRLATIIIDRSRPLKNMFNGRASFSTREIGFQFSKSPSARV